MYCVVKTITNVDSDTEASGIPKVYVYYCKTKKLAGSYVRRRYTEKTATLLKKDKEKYGNVKFGDSGIKGDNTWSRIAYMDMSLTTDPGYMYTVEEMRVVRGKEILDLPNGPSLKVE